MDLNDLASAGRTMSFNDLQTGAPHGEGEADDRNVELLLDDPRSWKGGKAMRIAATSVVVPLLNITKST